MLNFSEKIKPEGSAIQDHTSNKPIEYPLMWHDAAGIFHIDYGPTKTITVEQAKRALTGGEPLGSGKKNVVLTHGTCVTGFEEGVRELFFSDELGQRTRACALLINKEGFNELAIDLYLFFGEPPYPVNIFSDENEAMDWLRSYL